MTQLHQLSASKLIDCTFTRAPSNVSSRSVSFAPEPPYPLAAASSCSAVRIFQEDGKEVSVLTGHTAPVTSVQFGTQVLASASVPDRTVRFWDVKANKCVSKLDNVAAMNLQFHNKNTHEIAITERSGDIHIYDIRKLPTVLHAIKLAPRIAECCTYVNDEDYIITGTTMHGSGMADICVIDPTNSPQILFQCPSHAGPIYDMAVSSKPTNSSSNNRSRSLLATGGADAVVCIWDVQTLTCIQTIASKTKYIRSLDFSCSGNILAVGTEEETLDLYQFGESGNQENIDDTPLKPGVLVGNLHITGGIEAVCFHPHKEHILACARSYYHSPIPRESSHPSALANSPVTIVQLQTRS